MRMMTVVCPSFFITIISTARLLLNAFSHLFSQSIALKWLFSYVHSHHAETNTEFKIGFRRIFRYDNYNLLIDVGEFGHRHIRRRLMPTRIRYFFEMPFAISSETSLPRTEINSDYIFFGRFSRAKQSYSRF